MTKIKIYAFGFAVVLAIMAALVMSADAKPQQPDIILQRVDVVKVYDGDTIFVNIPNVPPVFGKRIGVRISNIDTPEMHSRCKGEQARAYERNLATEAKMMVAKQIGEASTITLTEVKRDKFFRINAVVLVDGVNVTDQLVAAKLARPYFGGTKQSWCLK